MAKEWPVSVVCILLVPLQVCLHQTCMGPKDTFTFTFTFSHLADTFIQSDLQLGTKVALGPNGLDHTGPSWDLCGQSSSVGCSQRARGEPQWGKPALGLFRFGVGWP